MRVHPLVVIAVLQIISRINQLQCVPPISLGVAVINALVFCRRELHVKLFGVRQRAMDVLTLHDYGLQPRKVWEGKRRVARLVMSNFLQLDALHLAVDMCSLLDTGFTLESSMRPDSFALLAAYSLVVPNVILVLIRRALAARDRRFAREFARNIYVGLSGTAFCLATTLSLQAGPHMDVILCGIRMPGRYAPFAELALLQLCTPGADLLHHVAGLIAGVAYEWRRVLDAVGLGRGPQQRSRRVMAVVLRH